MLAERTALHAVLETSTSDQHLRDARLNRTLDEPVIGHQIVLEMKQRLIVRQTRPCQMSQGVDAFSQRDDVQFFGVNVCRNVFHRVDPRHARSSDGVARHRAHFKATAQQHLDQMPANEPGRPGNQHLHSTVNSGTAITKRPPH